MTKQQVKRPIQNRIVVIVGKPGSGKTLVAGMFMSHYDRQFANFSVFDPRRYGGKKPRNGLIQSIY